MLTLKLNGQEGMPSWVQTPDDINMIENIDASLFNELNLLIKERRLHAVFQPILDMHGRKYLGYEALIRGPENSPLKMPATLFAVAQQAGKRHELEHACREAAIRDFAKQRFDGKLFLNLSASMLGDPLLMQTEITRAMSILGITPDRIVIEITENQKIADFSVFREVLSRYRRAGYQFAIDDLGEGFSNLRMWSEIHPEYVKIDRHFISGIANDVLKFRLVRSMVEIAEACGATLIAEGIEEDAEFSTIRDLGIRCGQGYLIERPHAKPDQTPSDHILKLLTRGRITVFPFNSANSSGTTVELLLRYVTPVSPDMDNDTVFQRFENDENLIALPVVREGIPLGMINRHTLIERFARQYHRELYGKRPCSIFMDAQPVMVDFSTPVHEVGSRLGQGARHQLVDGFIITVQGRYAGVGGTQELMKILTDLQIRSARYANPLTQLPGNVPINEHIERLLNNAHPFIACYVDIGNFKPYNDIYGYRRGDEVLQMLGNILSNHIDEGSDFVGHIGGDDFTLLIQSNDWQERCQSILAAFDKEILRFLEDEDIERDGFVSEDRRGQPTFHPLPTLSIGCVPVEAHQFSSHNELSSSMAEAKMQAKKQPGSSLFIERRRQPQLAIAL